MRWLCDENGGHQEMHQGEPNTHKFMTEDPLIQTEKPHLLQDCSFMK